MKKSQKNIDRVALTRVLHAGWNSVEISGGRKNLAQEIVAQ
jgi:hypothetical protein